VRTIDSTAAGTPYRPSIVPQRREKLGLAKEPRLAEEEGPAVVGQMIEAPPGGAAQPQARCKAVGALERSMKLQLNRSQISRPLVAGVAFGDALFQVRLETFLELRLMTQPPVRSQSQVMGSLLLGHLAAEVEGPLM
jgi:hypothetical protein